MENKEEQIIANILVMMEQIPVQGSDNIRLWTDCKEWLGQKSRKPKPKGTITKTGK